MNGMLYELCSLCRGSTWLTHEMKPHDVPPEHRYTIKPHPDMRLRRCPCAESSTPGLSPVGVTAKQLEGLAAIKLVLQGDPIVPRRARDEILSRMYERLASWGCIPRCVFRIPS